MVAAMSAGTNPRKARFIPLRFAAGAVLMAVCSLLFIVACLPVLPSRRARIRVGNVYGSMVGYGITRIAGTRPIIHTREKLRSLKPAIYVMNHTSMLDVWLGMWLCPMGGVGTGKRELLKVPFLGWIFWLSGHLLLDRGNRDRAIAAMDEVSDMAERYRMSIWIWPEGTRSKDGRLGAFKKGFGHLALATKLPIVPVIAHNAHHRWPNRTTALYPGVLDIDVLDPIDTRDWRPESLDEHIAAVREVMIRHLLPEQRPVELAQGAGTA